MTMYRRRLPHIRESEKAVFLTWSLYGSVPSERYFPGGKLDSGQVFAALEHQLDGSRRGPHWLRQREVSQIVEEGIRFGQVQLRNYECHAYAILSNHVHLLLTPRKPLPLLLASLKRYTARRANELLIRTGSPFWAEETFDRTIRNSDEFYRVRSYIENNPVKAGLATSPEKYRWSSAWEGFRGPNDLMDGGNTFPQPVS
jgi:putative transposase